MTITPDTRLRDFTEPLGVPPDAVWTFVRWRSFPVFCQCGRPVQFMRVIRPEPPLGFEYVRVSRCFCGALFWHDKLDSAGFPISAGAWKRSEAIAQEQCNRRAILFDERGGSA